jgi:hypothetical protein
MAKKTPPTYAGLMQSAQDNWPEDEAYAFVQDWVLPDPEGYRAPPEAIQAQREHVHSVFARETDSAELIARFEAEVVKLTKEG